MDSTYYTSPEELSPLPPRISYLKLYGIPLLLFLITFVTTTIAGTSWAGKSYWEITNWQYGITYSLLLMAFLSAHEFGHYFASLY
ncbi:MAG: hypothetical protein HYZ54_14690, partial [Ignavibacteriae bacterium]|nr:hypothetical protein [Ignavibacteriota bacterium]